MTSFTISDNGLGSIQDEVAIVTGASAGIGLATVRRLVHHGAKVFACDVNPLPSPESDFVPFMKVDVSSWAQQVEMFKSAVANYGKIDHVFANAGIKPTVTLLEDDVDENGDLLPPKLDTLNVNLIGCMYTVKLAIHYLRKNVEGGSIVMTASGSSFMRFSPTDYTTSKHGVLGLLRALYCNLYPKIPIRINSIAPSWTDTGIVPPELLAALGDKVQTPDVVARSVLALMTDKNRHGEMVFSDQGNFMDLENGEKGYTAFTNKMTGLNLHTEG